MHCGWVKVVLCAGLLNGAAGAPGIPYDALTIGLGDAPVDDEQGEKGYP